MKTELQNKKRAKIGKIKAKIEEKERNCEVAKEKIQVFYRLKRLPKGEKDWNQAENYKNIDELHMLSPKHAG